MRSDLRNQVHVLVFSDAIAVGHVGYEVKTTNGVSHGVWPNDKCTNSSTWRELVAVYKMRLSLGHLLSHQKVKWLTDNQGVKSIAKKG